MRMENQLVICLLFMLAAAKKLNDLEIIKEGMLENGDTFDSSYHRAEPIRVTLGHGKVIPGWEQGLLGMCVGEKRKLTIPPHLGYGSHGSPPHIPPDATLVFNTELVAIERESIEQMVMRLGHFLMYPTMAAFLVYYLYQKYKQETKGEKSSKGTDNRGKKQKRR
ncbi:hypothetical protein LSH36_40g22000 [Paralvinella palmiformis]|uniref:peptidylprolyl isomerase n=1 Tax=Paralvinella palmiformis TaxID=53620 RepID=A0AAD9NFG6_9ANNE|nr:hypothetical protein LSH36_40g22000 [Paralvinella palmiformis]